MTKTFKKMRLEVTNSVREAMRNNDYMSVAELLDGAVPVWGSTTAEFASRVLKFLYDCFPNSYTFYEIHDILCPECHSKYAYPILRELVNLRLLKTVPCNIKGVKYKYSLNDSFFNFSDIEVPLSSKNCSMCLKNSPYTEKDIKEIFKKHEFDKTGKYVNIAKKILDLMYENINTPYSSLMISNKFKIILSSAQKFFKIFRKEKIVKIVGVEEGYNLKLLYQVEESPLKEQEFVDFYDKKFAAFYSLVKEEHLERSRLGNILKTFNVNCYYTLQNNFGAPFKVYKKSEVHNIVEKYNLRRYKKDTQTQDFDEVKDTLKCENVTGTEINEIKNLLLENKKRMDKLEGLIEKSEENTVESINQKPNKIQVLFNKIVSLIRPKKNKGTLPELIKF